MAQPSGPKTESELALSEDGSEVSVAVNKGEADTKGLRRRGKGAVSDVVVPQEYTCPICLLIMDDPVVISDGCTYERTAITKWLDKKPGVSPQTGKPLEMDEMIPNIFVKKLIDDFTKKHPGIVEIHMRRQKQVGAGCVLEPSEKGEEGECATSFCGGGSSGGGGCFTLDMRNTRDLVRVDDPEELPAGTQVSVEESRKTGVTSVHVRHHGVYIARLSNEMLEQVSEGLRSRYESLVGKRCVVHLKGSGKVALHTVEEFAQDRPLSRHGAEAGADAVMRAISQVGHELQFDHVKHNCEHFATACVTGKKVSEQGERARVLQEQAACAAGTAVSIVGFVGMLLLRLAFRR
eukprot:CAMPEP_0196721018 /NCGR_PEP_ID=MMETSP1091-20130531/3687_1 /TAXON_ID=302021 /ORGANISM="Rhodomonas sp., Strain CCMP768" /LENGTH=348 /DNA_ID=CAMNT_0042062389 /DNA_START=1 /DNA_END=1047 /DNA_ORIENTATION=-